ncbi:hypothetical protein D3C86_1914410 [compost metagenome]
MGKTGPDSKSSWCPAAPVIQASATGSIALGENSKSSNSMARKTAAIGVPNIADMPAVAPAARITFRSLGVILNN